MTNHHEPENLATDNESSLHTLVRAITLSQGQFSLILLRCNYAVLRQRMVERLHQLSPVKIHKITLPTSVKTLYTNISEQLGDDKPPALMVFGLESVKDIKTVLTSANQVREEFRKNFSFPILLWVNDQVLQKFIRLATDLENWATIITFQNTIDDLVNFLRQKTDTIFADDTIANPQTCWELETALKDLQNLGEVLDSSLQASLKFVIGLNDYQHDRIDSALVNYQQSLSFWQQNNHLERQGILLVHIAIVYDRKAEKNQLDNQCCWLESKDYLQRAINIFEQAQCPNLVAKYISKLGKILRHLQAWSELQSLAEKSLTLHQDYGTPLQIAQDYGFLAEVALQQSHWNQANQLAQQALHILDNIPNLLKHEYVLYRFILARSQQGLGQISAAIINLEKARKVSNHQYDPQLYISILENLRSLYFDQSKYLDAFNIKQEQLRIEHQYGFRAFIGASYLNPQRQIISSAQLQLEHPETIAQEISASGREQDVNRLRERISRNDYKLTVIHGHSGVGKSSILKGGLIPALQQQAIEARDVLPILLRSYTDWVGMLSRSWIETFEKLRTQTLAINLDSSTTIIEQLRKNSDRNLLTVLIFDQFEEFFFVYTDQAQRRPFYDFLRVCLDIPFVKIILSLREDYLHYLLEFDRLFDLSTINNNILDKNIRYYLGNFSPKDAKAVVQNLTEKIHFYLESKLIDKLVQDLAGELGEVRPIELQIIGTQLQTEKITTLEKYCQFGTKEKLVERFLETVIHDCGSENECTARLILYLLTDENNIRPLKTRAELAADLATEAEILDLILKIFVESGLVLLLPEVPAERYQLVHDYLVSFIRQQQGSELLAELEKERQHRKLIEQELKRAETALVQVNAELQKQQTALKEAQEGTRLEREGVSALRQFEFAQLDSLILAMQSGKALQALVKDGRPLEEYPTTSPLLALRTILDHIQECNQIQGHQGWVRSVCFSPDGKYIATASDDCTARLWKVNGQQVAQFSEHQGIVWSVSFSPDGKYIATASSDHTARLWNLDGQLLAQFSGHQGTVWNVCFSPDGKYIATAADDCIARVWNFSGQLLAQFRRHQGAVRSVCFSPDGKYIATTSDDCTARLWSFDGDLITQFRRHQGAVRSVCFSPDGQYIVTAADDRTVRLWDFKGQQIAQFRGHQGNVWSACFSPDGQYIATVSDDYTARLWKVNGQQVAQFQGHQDCVRSVSFSPNGQYIATASSDCTVRLWHLNKQQFTQFQGHQDCVRSVSFSPNGQYVATASSDCTVRLWYLNGQEVNQFLVHPGAVRSVCFSPDGQYIATADRIARLWNLKGQQLAQFPGHQGSVWSVSFSPDSKYIATTSDDRTARLWNLDGQQLVQFQGHQNWVRSVSFSPDGQYIVTASDDRTARLWNLDGRQLTQFQGHQGIVWSVSFSPDGKYIVTASDDRTARLWNLDGQQLTRFQGHQGTVWSVSFSADSQYIATAADDGITRLWNLNGQQVAQFQGHHKAVRSVSFTRDGKFIATAADDHTARLWPVENLEQLLARGCNWLHDYLENNPNVSDRNIQNG
jgi:WD40 repeat protein